MDKNIKIIIVVLSVVIPVAVAFLMFTPTAISKSDSWVFMLPHINAAINATTSMLLISGLYFVKTDRVGYHRVAMLSAFCLGCLFLISYLIYHGQVPSTGFGGEGYIRLVYYTLLISHIVLAVVVVPFVLIALYYALQDKVAQHKRIVKIAYPIWLYVSVSGVLVYFLIRPYY